MGRSLRHLQPGTTWFVSTRCLEARFLLRPDDRTNSSIGLHLARAAKRFPGITLIGFVAMSNHLHLLLVDHQSQLSSFMEYFLGQLAKDINRIRHRRCYVFERRFSAEPVLDDIALRDRLLYLVLNPVVAALVAHHEQWPGLLLFAKGERPVEHCFRRFRQDLYEAARRRTRPEEEPPKPVDFYEQETMTVHPLPPGAGGAAGSLLEEIRRREGALWERRTLEGTAVLGVEGVLQQDPLAAPRRPKRSHRPLCHTAFAEVYHAFRKSMRALREAYAVASEAFRRGVFEVEFPLHVHRPGVPLLVVT
jgi:REP element-mobilizing transposase RayT